MTDYGHDEAKRDLDLVAHLILLSDAGWEHEKRGDANEVACAVRSRLLAYIESLGRDAQQLEADNITLSAECERLEKQRDTLAVSLSEAVPDLYPTPHDAEMFAINYPAGEATHE